MNSSFFQIGGDGIVLNMELNEKVDNDTDEDDFEGFEKSSDLMDLDIQDNNLNQNFLSIKLNILKL